MRRAAALDQERLYDLVVVGGGITGAGAARDAALRGLSTVLFEKRDFASGVSSKTTRLIHGGLRYLANFEVDLVAESLRERAILRRQAPYLVRPIPILIPLYTGDPHGRAVVSLGIHLYDLLSHDRDIPRYFTSNRKKTLFYEPRLNPEGLAGSALFFDHQILLPERLVIENVIAAREAGAAVLNYHRVERIEERGAEIALAVRDILGGGNITIRAKAVLNAAGPWIDDLRGRGGIDDAKVIHPTKGIHLVLPRLSEQALFVSSRGGRMFFIIPFGASTLVGTTDTNYTGDLDEVHADADDVDYLLAESRRVLPGLNLARESILYTYAGVRPLAYSGPHESRISRKHRVIREGRTGRIITIAGGKYTTYRNMSKDAVNAVCRTLGIRPACVTDKKQLPGGISGDYAAYLDEVAPGLSSRYRLEEATVRHLISVYGSRAERVLEICREEPELARPISPDSRDLYAQVAYSAAEEGGRTLSDIVLRRMHLGITAGRGGPFAEKLAKVAAAELGWSGEEAAAQAKAFREELKKEMNFS